MKKITLLLSFIAALISVRAQNDVIVTYTESYYACKCGVTTPVTDALTMAIHDNPVPNYIPSITVDGKKLSEKEVKDIIDDLLTAMLIRKSLVNTLSDNSNSACDHWQDMQHHWQLKGTQKTFKIKVADIKKHVEDKNKEVKDKEIEKQKAYDIEKQKHNKIPNVDETDIYNNGTSVIEWFRYNDSVQNRYTNKIPYASISKVWMTQNLDVDHYRNGDKIPEIKDADKFRAATTGAWCYYDNNPENGTICGKLYNWYAVNDPRGLAPEGWHIATGLEWTRVIAFCNGGTALIGTGSVSGLDLIYCGSRDYYDNFRNGSKGSAWWLPTDALYSEYGDIFSTYYDSKDITSFTERKRSGHYVRCHKD